MKSEEKQLAREMRRQGYSYTEILERVSVSKGTLSLWLRDIELTPEQMERLQERLAGGREKFIVSMRAHRDRRWAEFQREAEAEYPALCQDPEFMFGLALYIGEGGKADGNRLCFTNCDPRVVQKGLQFFLKIGIAAESIRCGIHLHPGLSKEEAKDFWQKVTSLPPAQFYAVSEAVSRASSGRKGNLQVYGTCQIYALSTKARQKVQRWMELALNAPLV